MIVSPETKSPLTFDKTIVEKLELSNATFSPAFAEPSVADAHLVPRQLHLPVGSIASETKRETPIVNLPPSQTDGEVVVAAPAVTGESGVLSK